MSLPMPVETLWSELQAVRAQVLEEAEGLSQRKADWKPGEKEWSVLGDLDLSEWWQLQARHDGIHLAQIRDVKRAPGFPKA